MQSVVHSVSLRGVDVVPVSVQAHISKGLPAMAIVGLADKSVTESKERVRSALSSLGLALPAKRLAINLAPADVLKEGAHFDLAIANHHYYHLLIFEYYLDLLFHPMVDYHPIVHVLSLLVHQ